MSVGKEIKKFSKLKQKKKNVDVIVYNANEDNDTQIKQIRLLIEKQVDVMVVIPYDKDGISEAIGEAKKKQGLKLLLMID